MCSASRRLNSVVKHELFRIAQEGINNAVRHAKSNRITIELNFQPDTVTLVIEDNGIGLPVDGGTEGFGLVTMRERAGKVGGTFAIQGKPGGGTQITITLSESSRSTEIEI